MWEKVQAFLRGCFRSASVVIFAICAGGVLAGFIFLVSLWYGLPDVSKLKGFQHSNSTEVYSSDSVKIGEYAVERRYRVRFDEIPPHVSQAFIAAEDSNFYEHGGIDFVGILRAIFTNILAGRYAQGGSTITQQVARSILLATRKKEITRKIREMILARQMENALSKEEILSLYLSEIYLGHGSYGIGAAARNYYQKEVKDLTIAEAAILAGLPQRPAEWDPFRNPYKSKRRQTYVLKRMLDEGYITETQANEAYAQTLKFYPLKTLYQASPYFTEYVRRYLMEKYGDENVLRRGYKVQTTVRHDFQLAAEKALDNGLRQVDKRIGWRGPIRHLESQEERQEFITKTHNKNLSKASPARILPPTVDETTKRLAYDMSFVDDPSSPFFGETPVKQGEYYQALVVSVDDENKLAQVQVGMTTAEMPIEKMEWVKIKEKAIKQISQVLVEGDVIHIKVESIDKTEKKVVASLEQEPKVQGALLSYEIDTGFVVAMVGGTDFKKSQFNRALQAKRQVGSTFKPLIYAAAFDKGYSPSSIVTDSPVVFKQEEADLEGGEAGEAKENTEVVEDWKPRNYGGRFRGEIPLRTALIRSMNIPTIKLLNEIGVDYGIQYARTLGISANLPRDLTIGLGSWSTSLEELMRAYSIFPRLGRPPSSLVYINQVTDAQGEILEEYELKLPPKPLGSVPFEAGDPTRSPPGDGLVISPQTAYMMTDLLRSVVQQGTGRRAFVSSNLAGKTGTSNDFHDAWFIGFSPNLMTGVWVGFDDQQPMAVGEGGGRAAAPIFAEYMKYALSQYPKTSFPVPEDIVFAYVDKETGVLATTNTANRVRVAFKDGSVPDSRGNNVPRVPEPGMQRYTTNEEKLQRDAAASEAGIPAVRPPVTPTQEEEGDLSDLLRDGY